MYAYQRLAAHCRSAVPGVLPGAVSSRLIEGAALLSTQLRKAMPQSPHARTQHLAVRLGAYEQHG